MFATRSLPDDLSAIRERYASGALVMDCDRDFETLGPPALDELATLAEGLAPHEYDPSWLPDDVPALLARLAGPDLTVGMPGDGSIVWTTQTTPPAVLVKPRVEGSPTAFVDFLIAEALVEIGLDPPETFLGFFRERYREFDAALDADPATTYQVAAAVYDAYKGVHTREEFEGWADERPRLHEAWVDAGERLQPRLDGLAGAVARGETGFADAAELACAGVKHDLDLPAPFGVLGADVYAEYGADYAVTWAEKL